MSHPFHIYRSSAGSGKTYTLSREYLKLALLRPGAFRHILGVTFTNKATEEMKSRIVEILKKLADGEDHPMRTELALALGMGEEVIQSKAKETLTDILHQYGRFAVVTIDSFFHQVIRSFAREMGLQGTFTIDLDLGKVMQQVIDQLLVEIGEEDQKQLRIWLTQFAESRVEEGQSWDFRKDIASLAREIFRDEFKTYSAQILKLGEQPDFFIELKNDLNKIRFSFENQVKKICHEVYTYLEKQAIDPGEFTRGRSGPIGLFYKVMGDDDPRRRFEVSGPRREAEADPARWLTKANLSNAKLREALESFLLKKYQELIRLIDTRLIEYISALEVQRYFYTFGILSEINRYLQEYRDEKDVMLIADLPDFLRQIIHDSETPYIYEKVGSLFSHYLIDEFQDTSVFQWDNFRPLVKNAADQGQFSMVVGDVKQSIYRFRGGDWELLQNRIREDIGVYHVLEETLGINWRSEQQLVHFNNTFFTYLCGEATKHFLSSLDDHPDPLIKEKISAQIEQVFSTYQDVSQTLPIGKEEGHGLISLTFLSEEENEEERWTEEAIRQTIRQVEELQRKGYELRDMAVLTRYAREGKKIADAFLHYRTSEEADPALRYEVVSSEALFLTSSHLVRFIVSLIQWLNDEHNTIVLSEWLYEYHRYIRKTGKTDEAIFSVLKEWKSGVPSEFVRQKEYLKTLPLYELVESIIRIFGLNEVKEEFTYLQGFQDAVLDYSKTERGDIPSFLEWWEEVRKERAIQVADENNAVKILTVHKAKGLEFPVVILPFLTWSMDHDYSKENILWVPGGERPPFSRLPVIPLKYTSKLADTYWAEAFYQERLKAFLDNLNLLYVALTRPIEALIAFARQPKNPDKLRAVNDLVYSHVSQLPEWREDQLTFLVGQVNGREPKSKETQEVGLRNYHSHPWRGKVSVQMKGSAELSEAVFVESTAHGIHLHQLLSRIRYKKDLDQWSHLPERVSLTEIVEHPSLSGWFEETWEVHCEVPILLPGGEFKRIDRLNCREGETLLIDFKTGTKREKDKGQIREYMEIMSEMGYKGIRGVLVYLSDMEIVKVGGG